jgi:hypothetical protein
MPIYISSPVYLFLGHPLVGIVKNILISVPLWLKKPLPNS